MVSARATVTVTFVVALVFLRVALEDVVRFLDGIAGPSSGVASPPLLVVVAPFLVSTLLLVVLVGSALWHDHTFR